METHPFPAPRNTQRRRGTRSRVFIVDDHPIVRRGLVDLIEGEPDLDYCGEAADAESAVELVRAAQADVVVLDLSLGSVFQGLDLIAKLVRGAPGARILVSSMHDEGVYAERVLRAGASGYVGKHESPDALLAAIRKVLAGGIAVSGPIASQLMKRSVGKAARPEGVAQLSQREFEVFLAIGRGLSTKEIAAELRLSPKTIETHRERIKQKLGVASGTELVVNAVRFRLEDEGEGG
jgi:DNA-binding NarL/FixJ family response regulator